MTVGVSVAFSTLLATTFTASDDVMSNGAMANGTRTEPYSLSAFVSPSPVPVSTTLADFWYTGTPSVEAPTSRGLAFLLFSQLSV